MSIRNIVVRGFGNGIFSGTIGLIVTRGYLPGVAVVARSVRWYIKPSGRLAGKSVGPARLIPGGFPEKLVVVAELEREAGVGPPPPPAAPLAPEITTPPLARRLTAALRETVAGVAFAEMLAMQVALGPVVRRELVLQEPTAEEGPIPGTPPVAEGQDNEISDDDLAVILALVVGL